ncbi:hypothetical protein [Enemella sp. A6]|uniref:hypothetical protein n=1 Tax=Enemella sp. A6 TaxID=3440152 RepID=UPI003EBDB6B7
MTEFDPHSPLDDDLHRLRPPDSLMDEELGHDSAQRMTNRILDTPAPRHNWRAIAVAAVAALVVGGVGAGTWALAPNGGSNAPAQQPAQPTEPADPTEQPSESPTEPTEEPSDSLSDDATEGNGDLENTPSAKPIESIPEDKYLFAQCTSEQQDGVVTSRREFIASDGWKWVAQSTSGGDQFYLLVDPAKNAAMLEGLPTDPAELIGTLRSGTGSNSATERAFKAAQEIMMTEMAGPELGKALVEALAKDPQDEGRTITVKDVDVDGVPAKEVTLTVQGGAPDLSGKGDEITDSTETMVVGTDGRLLDTTSRYRESEGESWYESTCRRVLVDEIEKDVTDKLGTDRVAKDVN